MSITVSTVKMASWQVIEGMLGKAVCKGSKHRTACHDALGVTESHHRQSLTSTIQEWFSVSLAEFRHQLHKPHPVSYRS